MGNMNKERGRRVRVVRQAGMRLMLAAPCCVDGGARLRYQMMVIERYVRLDPHVLQFEQAVKEYSAYVSHRSLS